MKFITAKYNPFPNDTFRIIKEDTNARSLTCNPLLDYQIVLIASGYAAGVYDCVKLFIVIVMLLY